VVAGPVPSLHAAPTVPPPGIYIPLASNIHEKSNYKIPVNLLVRPKKLLIKIVVSYQKFCLSMGLQADIAKQRKNVFIYKTAFNNLF
jgi:hypothetical protein